MKKRDFILIALLLIMSAVFFVYNRKIDEKEGKVIQIYSNNKLYKEISIDEETEFKIKDGSGYNIVKVHDGGVEVTEANCPDKVCVNTGHISKPSQTIVCVPNKLSIKIIDSSSDDHDVIVQ